MKKIIKIEINRAIKGIGIWMALAIGVVCILYQFIPIVNAELEVMEYRGYYSEVKGGFYSLWLPGYLDGTTIYYFYLFGIIAALPYGVSYFRDIKVGVIKNICNRVNRRYYIIAKYIATFVSGGLAVAIPLILDFFMVKLLYPVDSFEIGNTVLNAIDEGGAFMIDHPYLVAVIIVFAWFVFGGALATVSLAVSTISMNFFTIQLSPFFLMLILFYLPTLLPLQFQDYFPFYFLTLFGNRNYLISFGLSLLLSLITFAIFYILEVKKDIL